MQPRLQKGAYSGTSGLLQIGHFLGWSGFLGIPTRHGKSRVGPQPDAAAQLATERVEPRTVVLQHGDHCRVSDDALRAWRLGTRPPKQGSSLEQRAVMRQLDQ